MNTSPTRKRAGSKVVEVVPGVVGPRRYSSTTMTGSAVTNPVEGFDVEVVLGFDDEARRWLVDEFRVIRTAESSGPVSTTALRRMIDQGGDATIDSVARLMMSWPGFLTEQPRPATHIDGDPWGLRLPDGFDFADRTLMLAWVRHFAALGDALGGHAAREVGAAFGISRATALRWMREAEATS